MNLNQNIEGGINADLNGDIKIPKINEPNINIQGSIPQIKMPEHDPNFSGIIEGKMKGLKNKIDLKNKDIDIGLKGSKNIEIDGKIPKVELKSGNLDTNINIKDNIKMPEINELNPEIKVSTNIDKKLNIKTPEIYEDFTGVIIGTKDKTLKKDINIKANLPETKITGEIPGKGSLDIKKPKLDINGPKIGTNLDVNINKPGINVPSTDINVKGHKLNEPLFELKGEIPGKNIKAPKIELKPGEVDLNGKVDIPKLDNNKVNIDAKIPSIKQPDININAEKGELIFSGVIPGKKNIKVPNVKGDLKIDGNIKKPEIPNINSDINVGIDANKKLDLDQKIKGINIKSPEIGLDSPDINLKGKKVNLPNASVGLNSPNIDINGKIPKIEGNIPGIGINSDMSGIDLNGQVPKVDINIPKSDLNIEGNVPKVELENNIPEMKINGKIPGFDANIKKPELNINGEMDANIPKGEINFDGKFKKPDLKGINLKTNIPELNVKKPEGNLNIDGDIEGKKINIDLPDIIIDKDDEYLMRGIIRGKDYKDLKIKGDIDLKAPEIKGDIKGNTGINAQINSPNIDIPSGNVEINGPKLDKPNLPNANIKGKDINIDAKIPNVKADLNIKEPKGELIYSGVILGKKKIDAPKVKGDLKIDGKLNGPKIEGPNIELKKPDMNLNLDKDINIKSPEIDVNTPDINLKGKKVNLPNVSLGGNIPNADINANLPKIEGNIPGIDINAGIPKVDINGQIPNVNTDMKLKGKIPNVDLEGNIPNMDINVPKVDLEGNVPNVDLDINTPKVDLQGKLPDVDLDVNSAKVDLQGKLPNVDLDVNSPKVDIDFKKPNMDINGEINPNLNLSPKIDLPQGEMDIKGGIPDFNLDLKKDIKVPKIDASLEAPKLNDINLKADIPKTKIDIKKPEGNLNIEGKLGGKKLNVDMPNIKLNKDDEYFISGIIPGKDISNLNIKGSRRMQYDYNINQPEVNIKSSKLEFNKPDMNVKGSRRLDFEAPNLNGNIKGSRVLYNAQINSPNIEKPSGDINIKGPNVEVPNLPNANINDANIKIDGKLPNIKSDLNIKKPEGDLIFSGIILGKKKIDVPKVKGDLKIDGKLNGPKIEGPKIGLTKPDVDFNMKNGINIDKEININSPEIDVNAPDINLKGKKVNLPNVSLDGNIPNADINANLPKIEGNIPGIDINAGIPKVDINGQIPNVNTDMKLKGKIPNVDLEGNIPNMDINVPKVDLEGNLPNMDMNINAPKVDLKGNVPNVDLDINTPKVDLEGKIPNVDLDVNAPKVDLEGKIPNMDMNVNVPKVDLNGNILNPSFDINKKNLNLPGIDINGNVPNLGLNGEFGANLPNVEINNNNKMNIPSGEVNLEGQIPNINLNGNIENKDIKIPKIDAKIESPNIKDINIPGLGINKKDININKKNISIEGGLGEIKNSTGSFNMFGEIEGKGIKIDKPNINLNKDNEYYISGIIPGGDTNNINIKGSRRMLYDYNINQPEVNIKSSKLRFNQPDMNIKGPRRLDFQAPQLNDNIKGSRMIYDTQINTNTQNIPEISVNSPKIELKSGNKNIKLDKPEINIKEEGELIFSGVIPGKKELSKNIKLSANAPKVEIKADMDKPNIQNKVKMETDINPSLKNGINIEAKKFNILPSQNIDIQVESKDVKNSLKGSNNNIDIEMPKFNIEVNNEEKNQELNIEENNNNIEIEIPKVEINLDAQEQGQDNNLFNININNQESKVYAKKGIRGLPKVGLKKTDFVSSKIDVGGKLDVNNIDTSNLKPADAGANGTKIGNRIIE